MISCQWLVKTFSSFPAYHVPNWDLVVKVVNTHTPTNCFCRSPGTFPAIFIAESMMDHVARSLQLDVEAVKRANLYQKDQVCQAITSNSLCFTYKVVMFPLGHSNRLGTQVLQHHFSVGP